MSARSLRSGASRLRRLAARGAGLAAAAVARRIPEERALALGAALGRLLWVVLPRRRLVRRHLRIAFPDWSRERIEDAGRACFEELGRSLAEWSRLVELAPEELRERVEFRGVEHLERARAGGRGVLLATAHYGNWELLPAAWRATAPDVELAVVGRHFGEGGFQERIERRRLHGGGSLLRPDAREILRALRRGAAVGVLVDLYTSERRGGILVPFFGRRAWTTSGPAILSLRTGAPIVPVSIRRVEGARHLAELLPALEAPRTGDRARDVQELTARMSAVFEALIRERPEPWLWLHRRWKRSPDLPDAAARGLQGPAMRRG